MSGRIPDEVEARRLRLLECLALPLQVMTPLSKRSPRFKTHLPIRTLGRSSQKSVTGDHRLHQIFRWIYIPLLFLGWYSSIPVIVIVFRPPDR
ncbi:hypothetical protein AVEN_189525-1 [Araneus ventricosus]|uniref:Uncharacterized protein n=1 Tax=Araneus ventricosus TaxID=182803 RepID=A0A4Y2GLK0_ARAVE|nr:hypothetical protein AVEN_189525-1 [Araneus ventricosus]